MRKNKWVQRGRKTNTKKTRKEEQFRDLYSAVGNAGGDRSPGTCDLEHSEVLLFGWGRGDFLYVNRCTRYSGWLRHCTTS